jgi:hypothetical protein
MADLAFRRNFFWCARSQYLLLSKTHTILC